ncbi:sensor histidine kinase [Clostridium lundense]|uniref:sensor histidine kinase n=1 Tax=Clostridium lundense TaxID=319475 RepID=UPI000481516C|nr:HAMP domain-containing sensor histidine kinase [Clostridium lundense]
MENINSSIIIALFLIAVFFIIFSVILLRKFHVMKLKLEGVSEVLDDISQGNFNHKILVTSNDITAKISYKINEIIYNYQEEIIDLKKASETNKQLMTSLSHDVRTPLTTLIGYLDAVKKDIVTGDEKEQYLETARLKAYDMKEYVDMLFQWFKLNSNEETFTKQDVEISEVTRNILKDWITVFEDKALDFEIDIPEQKNIIQIDMNAYSRIMNNLIQNVVSHSKASCIEVNIHRLESHVKVCVADNGKGIAQHDLDHIFERLYKCDKARSQKGSGLGLSIVHKLVMKMDGTITVESEENKGTKFTIKFPLAS